jgi:hypothetical protein
MPQFDFDAVRRREQVFGVAAACGNVLGMSSIIGGKYAKIVP